MTDEAEIRLNDIRTGPWRDKSQVAREKMGTLDEIQARRYLRSHNEKGVYAEEEIDFRESFDQVLEELQIIELGIECGYLDPSSIQSVVQSELESVFRWPAARNYIQVYDYVPIRFLATRYAVDLGHGFTTPPPINPDAAVRFATFLSLHSDFVESLPVEIFTRLLDDYRFGGWLNATAFKQILTQEDLALRPQDQRRVGILCLGITEFVHTVADVFFNLDKEEVPLFGCIYAYWLSHFFGYRRTSSGYAASNTSFEDVVLNPILFPRGLDHESWKSEKNRMSDEIVLLKHVWQQTRDFIEMYAFSPA